MDETLKEPLATNHKEFKPNQLDTQPMSDQGESAGVCKQFLVLCGVDG